MKKRQIDYIGLIIGIIWFSMAILIFVGSLTNNLPASFRVPIIISWAYDVFGLEIASIIQIILSLLIIISSVSRKNANN